MTPCISQVTTLTSSFAEDVENYAAAGCRAVEVWLTKLEQHLESVSATDTRKVLANRGINLAAAAYQGGLLLSEGPARDAQFEQFRRRLDLCQTFGIRTLLVAPDFTPAGAPRPFGRAVEELARAARWAAGFGVRLALEFRGTDSFCTDLDTAVGLVEQCREPNAGVCLDLFHYYKGSSKPEDLDRLTSANLFHVQVSDVAGVPREVMADADRVMPGDGDFRPGPVIRKLREIGYAGAVSLELMNREIWRASPKQVVTLGLTALQRLLALR
jgi:2-keto-myo-inositol isomerase